MWFGIRTHTMLDLPMKALQLLFIVCLFQQCLSSAETTHNGIIFNYHQKILLAKSFENVRFVLPYPLLDATIDRSLTTIPSKMDRLWNHPNSGCDLLYNNITTEFHFRLGVQRSSARILPDEFSAGVTNWPRKIDAPLWIPLLMSTG